MSKTKVPPHQNSPLPAEIAIPPFELIELPTDADAHQKLVHKHSEETAAITSKLSVTTEQAAEHIGRELRRFVATATPDTRANLLAAKKIGVAFNVTLNSFEFFVIE